MKHSMFGIVVIATFCLACSGHPRRRIEPSKGAPPVETDNDEFVLSKKPDERQILHRADYPIHIEGKWLPFRAQHLDLTLDAARRRDTQMRTDRPPTDFWDEQTAIEAVSIWSALCNECHGGRRKLRDALDMPPPPSDWGRGEGLFFGRKRKYAEIFGVIFNGGPDVDGVRSEMPEWGTRLAKEQIWSLIFFLEYQSGGVEGRFPPSLYPRKPAEL